MTNSINTNIAAYYAQANITAASNATTESVARLSSGNAIVEASDNVAALAIGNSLNAEVSALTAAGGNASQGTSLLEVADGALAQIGSILNQQNSIALQAASGSLTDTDRGFLNQQFQALSNEINSLADGTTFNGVNLLDGSLSNVTGITSNTGTGASSAVSDTLLNDATTDFANGDTLTINGYKVTFATTPTAGEVTIGATKADTIANLAAFLNSTGAPQLANLQFIQDSGTDTKLDAVYAGGALGGALNITTALGTGDTGNATLSGSSGVTTIGAAGTANGLGVDGTSALGTITGSILANGGALATTEGAGINTTGVENNSSFTGALGSANVGAITAGTYAPVSDTAVNDDQYATGVKVAGHTTVIYTLSTDANASTYHVGGTITIGGAAAPATNDGVTLVAGTQYVITAVSGTTVTFDSGQTATAGSTTFASAANASTVTASDQANFTVQVGGITYTSSDVGMSTSQGFTAGKSVAPVAVTFTGKNSLGAAAGGTFTLNLAGNGGITTGAITSQSSLAAAAAQLNSALGGITFQQNRDLSSFSNSGSNILLNSAGAQIANLTGATANLNTGSFSTPATNITSLTVTAPTPGSADTDAVITAVIGGDTYTSLPGIGDTIQTNSQIILQDASNPTQTLTLTMGTAGITGGATTALNLTNSANAATVQTALQQAFGINQGLSFQLGTTTQSNVGVNIGGATTSALFDGASLDISTQTDATTAAAAVTAAINTVTSLRAGVGALESQFNFASAALQSSTQNQAAAAGQFLDTNIATASTQYATEQVQLQAGISVLAQANQQVQALLKLIGT